MQKINIDYDELEDELDLVVPNIYRMFIDAVIVKKYDLAAHRIFHDTASILKGNLLFRDSLSGAGPKWEDHYFHFGVGDGCGNFFFVPTSDEEVDLVQLLAHDPPGIEEVGGASQFFQEVLEELACGFDGPNKFRFDGARFWD